MTALNHPFVQGLGVCLVAGGSAFFGANWADGWTTAFQAAGVTFCGTAGAMLGLGKIRSTRE